ncbi:conserved Plasmodium protein, unknown function [Plasmodium yoelii]|uniref:Uncharacterized protein n=2 Tax=Plasmodium yoelii TaxID=5861 RepID=A0AAE9WVS7_PLAYO|nr:conserved Plasmodium protein, unknown function [Plasmodium yoelii]WBY59465.1 hypothetical protein Py17XNL_001205274 [Plasmodium yoelii yoelii]CDU19585.1 conserved Plasmodium protein, unknown function [Plasmodium yoelii]VTZ80221.1 conserved Plasmodium protein, unknown function [Plasmodium yoelii]|eukprot:XP_022812727.1 conserved Plasmodium protein, unknown function [Plasmodium yoelii]
MENFPYIVILSHNKDKIQNFVKYLLTQFEVIEHYNDEEWDQVLCENKEGTDDNLTDFIFKKEAKIEIVNKYYQAQVIILSCIPYSLNEKQNDDSIKKKIINNNLFSDHNKYKNLKLNCEGIIFLFNKFNEDSKKIINNNPFINLEAKCNEYIKDTKSGKMIKNDDFDFSNLYKDIGVKIAIFPLLLQKNENQILQFCTEYFIECLYIEYESNNTDNQNFDANNKIINQNKKKINKIDEFYDNDAERFIEALHCHMWKGLQLKNGKINIPNNENTKKNDKSQDISLSKEKSLELKNNEQKESSKNSEEKLEKNENQKKNDQSEKKNNSDTHDRKDDKFMENFNQIVEKIKLAKIENKKCNNDSERRKKAENMILELQQYFYGMDEE